MSSADRLPTADLPDSPHARQLRAGFPWLTFNPELEKDFRCTHFDENLVHTRVNLCLAVAITVAFSAMDAVVLGPVLNRVPGLIHMLVIIPTLLIGLAASFSPQRHRIYPPLAMIAATILGLGVAATQIIATLGGVSILFPCLMLTIIFIYFMGGLIFYHAVAANVIVMFVYLAAGTELELPGREFAYDALALGGVTRIWRADVVKLGSAPAGGPFALAFVDPPYGQGLAYPALASLVEGGWLEPNALCVVEEAAKAEIAAPAGLALIDERVYGDTKILIFQTGAATPI